MDNGGQKDNEKRPGLSIVASNEDPQKNLDRLKTIGKLKQYRVDFEQATATRLKVGDVVEWIPNGRFQALPAPGKLALVLELLEPVQPPPHTISITVFDTVLATEDHEGDIIRIVVDSRYFRVAE